MGLALPIILVEDHTCVDFYATLEDAEMNIEVPDVDVVSAYDACGRKLEKRIIGSKSWGTAGKSIILSNSAPEMICPDELRRILLNHLRALKECRVEDESAPLEELVDRAWKLEQAYRGRRKG